MIPNQFSNWNDEQQLVREWPRKMQMTAVFKQLQSQQKFVSHKQNFIKHYFINFILPSSGRDYLKFVSKVLQPSMEVPLLGAAAFWV